MACAGEEHVMAVSRPADHFDRAEPPTSNTIFAMTTSISELPSPLAIPNTPTEPVL